MKRHSRSPLFSYWAVSNDPHHRGNTMIITLVESETGVTSIGTIDAGTSAPVLLCLNDIGVLGQMQPLRIRGSARVRLCIDAQAARHRLEERHLRPRRKQVRQCGMHPLLPYSLLKSGTHYLITVGGRAGSRRRDYAAWLAGPSARHQEEQAERKHS